MFRKCAIASAAAVALTCSAMADDGRLAAGKPAGIKEANLSGISPPLVGLAIAIAIGVAYVVDKQNTVTSTTATSP